MHVLWVENHAGFVRAAGRFLTPHEVTVVPSVAEACDALAARSFDVVLVDFDLNDGKGTAIVEMIRSLRDRPRIIAVSSHADGNAALAAAGADATCPKMQFANIGTVMQTVAQPQ